MRERLLISKLKNKMNKPEWKMVPKDIIIAYVPKVKGYLERKKERVETRGSVKKKESNIQVMNKDPLALHL